MKPAEMFFLASDVVEALLRSGFSTIRTPHGLKVAVEQGRLPQPSLQSPKGTRGWTADDLDKTLLAMRHYVMSREREKDRWKVPVQMVMRKGLEEVG